MKITEEKIRKITQITIDYLGSNTNTEMVKKVVNEVIRRLHQDIDTTPKELSY